MQVAGAPKQQWHKGAYQELLEPITGHYSLAIVGAEARAYGRAMSNPNYENSPAHGRITAEALKLHTLLKSVIFTTFAVMALATVSLAAELPEAPSSVIHIYAAMMETSVPASEPRIKSSLIVDKKFLSLAFISTSSTFADSYTTLFARQNWLAGKTGVCNEEVESPYLYGTHPTVTRAYAVATIKSVSSVFAAYYLRKHHSRLWPLLLIGNSASSLQGVTQNMKACN
jgi:hypothetical protein